MSQVEFSLGRVGSTSDLDEVLVAPGYRWDLLSLGAWDHSQERFVAKDGVIPSPGGTFKYLIRGGLDYRVGCRATSKFLRDDGRPLSKHSDKAQQAQIASARK